MKTYRIEIDGMGCQHCVNSVREALTAAGAEVHDVQIGEASVRFSGDTETLKTAIEDRGFDVLHIVEA